MKKLTFMTRIRRRYDRLLKNRSGQSTTEYILILAIVVMIASKMKGQLQSTFNKAATNMDSAVEDAFKP